MCALNMCEPPLLKEKIITSEHQCPLNRKGANNEGHWNCDVSCNENGAGIRCQSAIPGFHMTKNIQGYRCQ